jgi:hypothetical protein
MPDSPILAHTTIGAKQATSANPVGPIGAGGAGAPVARDPTLVLALLVTQNHRIAAVTAGPPAPPAGTLVGPVGSAASETTPAANKMGRRAYATDRVGSDHQISPTTTIARLCPAVSRRAGAAGGCGQGRNSCPNGRRLEKDVSARPTRLAREKSIGAISSLNWCAQHDAGCGTQCDANSLARSGKCPR